MATVEELNKIVTSLKLSMDYLMIRVTSCEQLIQKLFKIVGESSNMQDKFSSLDQINCSDPTSPDKPSQKKITKNSMQLGPESPFVMETYRNKKVPSPPLTSLNNFLLLPSCKQTRSKQLQTGSLTLMKNAILVNIHEIEKLQQSYANMREEYNAKFNKSDQAIELLTNVMALMQDKMEGMIKLGNVNPSTGRTTSKNKSSTKSRRNRETMSHYIAV